MPVFMNMWWLNELPLMIVRGVLACLYTADLHSAASYNFHNFKILICVSTDTPLTQSVIDPRPPRDRAPSCMNQYSPMFIPLGWFLNVADHFRSNRVAFSPHKYQFLTRKLRSSIEYETLGGHFQNSLELNKFLLWPLSRIRRAI
ncbi:hypothetical protein CDAR_60721 [Caerostris darwini]|uniref:Uncharacterized protein n=1 Tax=Caerostris darwini TaxID=1538125 RepID=A0AAV4VHT0_9ARAC|nr:hypothetical protein CDAR_60721 [Caerostris darwini]